MWHTVLIVLHASAATVALLAGAAALRADRWFGLHRWSLLGAVAALVPAVALSWAGLDPVTRAAYGALLVLAGAMLLRTERARRCRPARTGGPTAAYVAAVGFTLISLADGFAVVAAVRSGLPGIAVAAVAVGVVAAGHLALQAVARRVVPAPAAAVRPSPAGARISG